MLKVLCFTLIASLSGCATLGQLMESKEAKRKRVGAEKTKKKYAHMLADARKSLAAAKAAGMPTDSEEAWKKSEIAWRRAQLVGPMQRCKSKKRYHREIKPYCADFKVISDKAVVGYAQFLKKSAESAIPYYWLQRVLFNGINSSALTKHIDAKALLPLLVAKKRAYFDKQLAKVDRLRGYVKRKTMGTCVFAKSKFSPNVGKTKPLTYLFDNADQTINIGCITKNKRSLYKRDQPDRLVLSYWWHGRYVQLHTIPLEKSGATDELRNEVSAELLIEAMDKVKRRSPAHFNWPGEWIWMKAQYVVSHKDGFRWSTDRYGRRVARPRWRHKTIADGTFYFKYVR